MKTGSSLYVIAAYISLAIHSFLRKGPRDPNIHEIAAVLPLWIALSLVLRAAAELWRNSQKPNKLVRILVFFALSFLTSSLIDDPVSTWFTTLLLVLTLVPPEREDSISSITAAIAGLSILAFLVTYFLGGGLTATTIVAVVHVGAILWDIFYRK